MALKNLRIYLVKPNSHSKIAGPTVIKTLALLL